MIWRVGLDECSTQEYLKDKLSEHLTVQSGNLSAWRETFCFLDSDLLVSLDELLFFDRGKKIICFNPHLDTVSLCSLNSFVAWYFRLPNVEWRRLLAKFPNLLKVWTIHLFLLSKLLTKSQQKTVVNKVILYKQLLLLIIVDNYREQTEWNWINTNVQSLQLSNICTAVQGNHFSTIGW